jgi:hypothetical protein
MRVNPKIQLRKRRTAEFVVPAGPQTKLRTSRKLLVLHYISYMYVFPYTNHHSKKSARADALFELCNAPSMPSAVINLARARA